MKQPLNKTRRCDYLHIFLRFQARWSFCLCSPLNMKIKTDMQSHIKRLWNEAGDSTEKEKNNLHGADEECAKRR